MGESFVGDHSDGDSYRRVRELAHEIACLQAAQLQEIAALDADRDHAADVVSELALELAVSENMARNKIALARDLITRMPNTLAAMERGDIDSLKASKIADPVTPLSDEKAREVDALMTGRVAGRDPSRIRQAARRAVLRVDPGGAEERAHARRQERGVGLRHRDDGMATLDAELPAEVASAAYARVDRIARSLRGAGEVRTMEQLRADVFSDLLLGRASYAASNCTGDDAGGRTATASGSSAKAEVFVHVDLATLAGLADDPAELPGHGPIPASIAREIAANPGSTWRRLVTDPLTGAPLDVGRTRYRPPAVTAEFVRVRDRECRFPTCHRPAQASDIDHVTDWASGGSTDTHNLVGLCRRHHRLKRIPGWHYRLAHSGRLTITTPSSATYDSTPDTLHEPDEPDEPDDHAGA